MEQRGPIGEGNSLAERTDNTADQDSADESGQSGQLQRYHQDYGSRRNQQNRIDLEIGVQRILYAGNDRHIGFAGDVQPQNGVDDQCDNQRRGHRPQHVLDVFKEICTCHGGRQVCRIRKRRHFISEISAGDNCTCGHGNGNSQSGPYADKGNAHGTCRSPGRTGRKRYDTAEDTAGSQKKGGF